MFPTARFSASVSSLFFHSNLQRIFLQDSMFSIGFFLFFSIRLVLRGFVSAFVYDPVLLACAFESRMWCSSACWNLQSCCSSATVGGPTKFGLLWLSQGSFRCAIAVDWWNAVSSAYLKTFQASNREVLLWTPVITSIASSGQQSSEDWLKKSLHQDQQVSGNDPHLVPFIPYLSFGPQVLQKCCDTYLQMSFDRKSAGIFQRKDQK